MTRTKKRSKVLKLLEEDAKGIIVYNHELNNFYKQDELVNMTIDIKDKKTLNRLNKIAKCLKVSVSSVVCYTLFKQMELENGKTN